MRHCDLLKEKMKTAQFFCVGVLLVATCLLDVEASSDIGIAFFEERESVANLMSLVISQAVSLVIDRPITCMK